MLDYIDKDKTYLSYLVCLEDHDQWSSPSILNTLCLYRSQSLLDLETLWFHLKSISSPLKKFSKLYYYS